MPICSVMHVVACLEMDEWRGLRPNINFVWMFVMFCRHWVVATVWHMEHWLHHVRTLHRLHAVPGWILVFASHSKSRSYIASANWLRLSCLGRQFYRRSQSCKLGWVISLDRSMYRFIDDAICLKPASIIWCLVFVSLMRFPCVHHLSVSSK